MSKVAIPANGQKITLEDGKLNVPDNPIIPFIDGDGTGPGINGFVKNQSDVGVYGNSSGGIQGSGRNEDRYASEIPGRPAPRYESRETQHPLC